MPRQAKPSISVVIPAYRSGAILPKLVEELEPVLAKHALHYELILVNDASPDDTWGAVESLTRQHPWISGIDLMRNFGQHNALLAGIRAAQHDIIVTMDDDLQHPPDQIPLLLAKLDEGYDVVYGTPMSERHELLRTLASQIIKLTMQATMGVRDARNVSAFRVFRTMVRDSFEHYRSPYVTIDVLLSWGTTRFTAVPVQHHPRYQGKSNYNFVKLLAHALNMMTGFSTLPLQFASLIGFMCTLLGIGVLIYVVGRYLVEGGSIPGFPFLASTIAIFSGVQLFALWAMGLIPGMQGRTKQRLSVESTVLASCACDAW